MWRKLGRDRCQKDTLPRAKPRAWRCVSLAVHGARNVGSDAQDCTGRACGGARSARGSRVYCCRNSRASLRISILYTADGPAIQHRRTLRQLGFSARRQLQLVVVEAGVDVVEHLLRQPPLLPPPHMQSERGERAIVRGTDVGGGRMRWRETE